MRLKKGRYAITGVLILIALTAAAYAMSQNHISYVEKFETDRVNINLETFSVLKTGESAESTGIVQANKDISYIPRITNEDAACYVRARVDITADGDDSEPLDGNCLYGVSEDWVWKGDYLYCTKLIEEGASTDVFKGIHIPENWNTSDTENLKVSVKAEAVQAKNFKPDFSDVLPWGAVKLEEVADAGNQNVTEVVQIKDISELKYNSAGSFECSTEDLFEEYSEMMPGDSFEKTVVLQNHSVNPLQMYLSLSSGGKKLGESLRLKITWDNTDVYDGTLADAVEMDKIKMIKLAAGEKYEIKLVINLPANAKNEYASLEDCLIWQLNAEEMPEASAQTSDWDAGVPLAAVVIFSGLLMLYALGFRRRGQL